MGLVGHSYFLPGYKAGGSERPEQISDLLNFPAELGMAGNETGIVNLKVKLKTHQQPTGVRLSFCFPCCINQQTAEAFFIN